MTVFNSNEVDTNKQPMFFGESLGVQRYDTFKYPVFDKLTQKQLSFFWRPEEVPLLKDRNDYATLRPEQKFIFTSNLKYQTMLDSVQGRGPALTLLPICSLPELEGAINAWNFFEGIHSRSYTYIIKALYSNPSEIFDSILRDEEITNRAKSVTKSYNDLLFALDQTEGVSKEKVKYLFQTLITINILEGLRFFISFACTFAFAEAKVMEGSAKIISLIARDESQHLAITQHILNKFPSDIEFGDTVMRENKDWVIETYKQAVIEEKAWAKYLFKDGSMIGLSEGLLSRYVEWLANKRLKALGYDPIYDIKANDNPLPWTQHWLSSKELQIAPQESQLESYLVGSVKQDVSNDTFKDFTL
jgi:ribonucleotide reductase beta subunit family protein with ferritin-like domain